MKFKILGTPPYEFSGDYNTVNAFYEAINTWIKKGFKLNGIHFVDNNNVTATFIKDE